MNAACCKGREWERGRRLSEWIRWHSPRRRPRAASEMPSVFGGLHSSRNRAGHYVYDRRDYPRPADNFMHGISGISCGKALLTTADKRATDL